MSNKKKTILIVDDSRVSRMMLKSQVQHLKPDWLILEANNGEEACEIVKENTSIDYFSIDLNMPGMDGLELIAKLQSTFATSRMALLTANIQEEVFNRAIKHGAACFHKPITEKVMNSLLEYFHE
ncbi:MAG: response regulator [Pseudomonadota bacterium]